MATAQERQYQAYKDLTQFAQELAESWINGNRSDVLETLAEKKDPALTLFAVHFLGPEAPAFTIAYALFERSFEG